MMRWLKGVAAFGVKRLRNEELYGVAISLRVILVDDTVVATRGVENIARRTGGLDEDNGTSVFGEQ